MYFFKQVWCMTDAVNSRAVAAGIEQQRHSKAPNRLYWPGSGRHRSNGCIPLWVYRRVVKGWLLQCRRLHGSYRGDHPLCV